MIRRKKTTIFTDAKDNTTVKELKQMIEGVYKFWIFLLQNFHSAYRVGSASIEQNTVRVFTYWTYFAYFCSNFICFL